MPPEKDWDAELARKVKEAYHGEFDLEAARQQAIQHLPKNHVWRQFGPHVVCESCHPQHSQYVGIAKSLTVTEEGGYILVDRF